MTDETIIQFGSAIKALGNGRVGGYLVKFADASTPDLAGEFFDATTDFDIESGDPTRVYYNHGLDERLKRRKLGKGTLTVDDTGVWVEAQLALRDEYEQAIYAMAEAGKLGWSSGSLPNLVEYESVGEAVHIKSWPLGKDASLTPTPAAGLVATQAMPLKAWAEWQVKNMKSIDLQERFRLVGDAVERQFNSVSIDGLHRPYTFPEFIYEDFVIIRRDSQRWKVPYTLDAQNSVTLGEAESVEMIWQTTKSFLGRFDAKAKTWQVGTGQPADIAIKARGAEIAQPEAGRSPAAVIVASAEPETVNIQEVEMGNELDLSGILDAIKAQGEMITGLKKQLENEPAVKSAGVVIVEDEADKRTNAGPRWGFGDFLLQVKRAGEGEYVKDLMAVKSSDPADEGAFNVVKAIGADKVGSLARGAALKAAPTGIGESIPQAGGFLVGSDRAPGILERTYASSQILQRVPVDTIGPNSNGMTYYANAETSRVTGSRMGGLRGYWVAENSEITASAPKFRKMELKLQKLAVMCYATEEQLADTSALESWINRALPNELRFMLEASIIEGTGAGQPLGILNSNAIVSVTKEVNQVATTLVAQNISKMWARRWIGGAADYVWLYNQDVEPQLDVLSYSVGTGGQLVYMPPGGLSGLPYGTIKGRPAIATEYNPTLGTVGDLMLADLSQYQMIDKGGVQAASSMHVRFVYDEQVFKFTIRVDGQPVWNAALTPFKGTNTVSPFVAVATRA